ncbi:hypothetical protein APX84_00080 [Escherichia coli]|nr:hypothetical protein APX84_00080 [Escherichia coli]
MEGAKMRYRRSQEVRRADTPNQGLSGSRRPRQPPAKRNCTGEPVAKVCYAQMMKQFLRRAPFECVLCGGRMVYRRAIAGLNVDGLKKNARDISLQRYVPA